MIQALPDELAELLDDASPASDAASDAVVDEFMAEHNRADMPQVFHGWRKALQKHFEIGSRHDGTVKVTVGALKEAAAGYFPAQAARDALHEWFLIAATRPPTGGEHQRSEEEAEDEFKGIVAWAVAQALAADIDQVRARTQQKMPNNTDFGHPNPHMEKTDGTPI